MSSKSTLPVSSDVGSGLKSFGKLLVDIASLLPPVAEWRRESAKMYRQRAADAFAANNNELAIAHLMIAVGRDPENSGYYADLGQIYYHMGDYVKAKEQYTAALKQNYFDLRAQRGLGYSHQSLAELAEATYIYFKYLEQDPRDADILRNLAVCLHDSGKLAEAVDYYTKAEVWSPDDAFIPENRGRALYALGRFDESIQSMRRALELNPGNSEAHRFLGLALEAKSETEQALASYAKALELDSNNGLAHMDMSRLLRPAGKYSEAVEHDKLAVKVFQEQENTINLAPAYWELGWDYYQLGDWANSIEASRMAVALQPDLYSARFNLALALLHHHRREEALAEYQRAAQAVSLASDLKHWGMNDLEEALKNHADLPGGAEIFRMLEQRYETLRQDHQLPSEQPASSAAV